VTLYRARFDELSPTTLYDILQLRSDIFVVEQECLFLDMDGRDSEHDAVHLWIEDGGRVVAYARVVVDDDATVIGRVVTRRSEREHGLGRRVMHEAIAVATGLQRTVPVAIKAQTRLRDWYESFGFKASGPNFFDDGILHTPMELAQT
jgi:ElaA protein